MPVRFPKECMVGRITGKVCVTSGERPAGDRLAGDLDSIPKGLLMSR
jgi:hypothetical protein